MKLKSETSSLPPGNSHGNGGLPSPWQPSSILIFFFFFLFWGNLPLLGIIFYFYIRPRGWKTPKLLEIIQ